MKTILGGLIMAVLIATGAQAEVRTERIEYKHGDTLLEGFLAYDDTVTGKRPGVLVVHEWWGLNDYAKRRAEQLARLGYVAFCLDMYGKGKVTADPKVAGEWAGVFRNDRPLGRARAAAGLEVLKSRPQVDPARIRRHRLLLRRHGGAGDGAERRGSEGGGEFPRRPCHPDPGGCAEYQGEGARAPRRG